MQKRQILLVEPPFHRLYKDTMSFPRYPLSLGYLTAAVKEGTDWEAVAYNADFSPISEPWSITYMAGAGYQSYLRNLVSATGKVWQEVRQVIEMHRPQVVGISTKSANFPCVRMVAGIAKESDPRTVVIVGGPHPSTVGTEVLRCPDIDIGVRGEGERTLVELLQAIGRQASLDGIPGVVFRKNGAFIENPPRPVIKDLDSLSFPHAHAREVLTDFAAYPLDAFSSIFSTRGCPFNCFFCGSRYVWGRHVRHRSVENVLREINALRSLGIREIHFEDDTFGVSRERIRSLCSALAKDCPGLRWSCEMHVNLVDDAIIQQMRTSGCFMIRLGIESGSDQILKAMRKGFTIEKALAAARSIKNHGITLFSFFMIGFPQETEETIRDTMRAIEQTDSDSVIYSIFTPYPGTEAFEYCRLTGMIDETFDVSLYNHQSPANHFSLGLSRERFRELAGQVERTIHRRNFRNRIKRIFSGRTLVRLRELGLRQSVRRFVAFLRSA